VIAMSAHAGREISASAIEAGCVEFLTKPFTQTQLTDAINRNLDSAA